MIAIGFEPMTVCLEGRCSIQLSYATKKKSGWQDSNLRPPAPKAGAMTGLKKRRTNDVILAERPRLELGEHLRVHRLAICCITTLPPLHSYNQTGVQKCNSKGLNTQLIAEISQDIYSGYSTRN